MKNNKTQSLLPILLFFLALFIVGGGIWYGAEIALPNAKAEKAEQIRLAQEAEAAARLASEGGSEQASDYDYSIPITAEAISEAAAAGNKASADDAVNVTTDDNGDVWITRDWSNSEGLNETDPPDPNADKGGAKANMASGGTDIPFDSNGVYSEHRDEGTTTPGGSTAPTGGTLSGKDTNPGSGSTPTGTTTNPDSGSTPTGSDTGNSGGNPNTGTQPQTGGIGNTTNPGGSGGNGDGGNGGNAGSGSPKPGDTKIVDGQTYMYDSIFGWTLYGGPGVGTAGSNAGAADYGTVEEDANF